MILNSDNLTENLSFQRQIFGRVIFITEVLILLYSLEGKGDLPRWALMLIHDFYGMSTCQVTQPKLACQLHIAPIFRADFQLCIFSMLWKY